MEIIRLDEALSTNDVAEGLGKKGAPHFTCVVASRQTKGRGRRGKTWVTLDDKSIACSVILRKQVDSLLPLVASLAVYDTVSSYVPCTIKWPNDILIDGKKVSGILAEKFNSGDEAFYVLGIGINVKKYDPSQLQGIASTSIENEIDVNISLDVILDQLLGELSHYLAQSTGDVLKRYRQNCATIGSKITWKDNKKTLTGIAQNITKTGSLILNVDGVSQEIMTGTIIAQGSLKGKR